MSLTREKVNPLKERVVDELDQWILDNQRKKWGLSRLFRYFRQRRPCWGESVVLARILTVSARYERPFPRHQVQSCIRLHMTEELEPATKAWLWNLGENVRNPTDPEEGSEEVRKHE